MIPKLFYGLCLLGLASCKPGVMAPEKVKKIAVHTFTGMAGNNDTTNWFYIKNAVEMGFSGYYLESPLKLNDFKQAQFSYYNIRPPRFEGQYASGEKILLIDPADLPETILQDSSHLESVYE